MADITLKNRSELEELMDFLVPGPKAYPVIASAKGAVVTDIDGKDYFDFEGGPGVCNVGHCHPRVVEAIRKQTDTIMQGPGKYHTLQAPRLARRIAALTEDKLTRVFFTNSGSESNDGAIKLALKHAVKSGKKGYGIVSFEHGYHGRHSLTLSVTGVPHYKHGLGPYASFPGVVQISPPYTYRCPYYGRTPEESGDRAAQALRDAIKWRAPGEIAVMIAEPILGLSGVIVPPDNYWPQVAEICEENNITLILDEVYVGFGRTGKVFAHQHWGISPSIITFAKAIGGGLPLGGFIARDEVGTAFSTSDHNTTFGSNNLVGIAAGHAVLDILEEERLAEKAAKSGDRMMDAFRRSQAEYRFIGDVRGKGLVIGVEIVLDQDSKEPGPKLAKQIQDKLCVDGLLVGLSGVHGNVLRLSPPLVMTDDEVGRSIELFTRAFKAVA